MIETAESWLVKGNGDSLSISKQLLFLKLSSILAKFCAFSVTAPTIWNQLPITIKSSETTATFRKEHQDIFV